MHGDVIAHILLEEYGCEQSAPGKQETPESVLVKARGLRAKPGFWQGGAYPYTCDEPALASTLGVAGCYGEPHRELCTRMPASSALPRQERCSCCTYALEARITASGIDRWSDLDNDNGMISVQTCC